MSADAAIRANGRMVALADLAARERLGGAIAQRLRPGDVVALTGDLGAGKTTLARAIIRAAGHAGEVPSPSFAIVEHYATSGMSVPVVHADFYRLAGREELDELGLDDYRRDAALIAEWPERVGGFAHDPSCLSIALLTASGDVTCDQPADRPAAAETGDAGRIAIVAGGADWLGRMPC